MRLLVFSDSRGTHVDERYNCFDPYTEYLKLNYGAHVIPRPEYWTTIVDFISYMDNSDEKYDKIILHAGFVDWYPKPKQYLMKVVSSDAHHGNESKLHYLNSIFGKDRVKEHLSEAGEEFEGEATCNLYSVGMAEDSLVPLLKEFNNLIFINANKIVSGWHGDYPRGARPPNANMVLEYSNIFNERLGGVNVAGWSDCEVMRYTHDNVHLNKLGNEYILNEILERIG